MVGDHLAQPIKAICERERNWADLLAKLFEHGASFLRALYPSWTSINFQPVHDTTVGLLGTIADFAGLVALTVDVSTIDISDLVDGDGSSTLLLPLRH